MFELFQHRNCSRTRIIFFVKTSWSYLRAWRNRLGYNIIIIILLILLLQYDCFVYVTDQTKWPSAAILARFLRFFDNYRILLRVRSTVLVQLRFVHLSDAHCTTQFINRCNDIFVYLYIFSNRSTARLARSCTPNSFVDHCPKM